MKDRIREILKHEKLTSAQFADKIGVQRSSISHILSGRNKPGFDFIQKILLNFPVIDAEWLITGNGGIYKKSIKSGELFSKFEEVQHDKSTIKPKIEERIVYGSETSETTFTANNNRKIEKILVFYSDKTFREYEPEK
jgi:transcriptional regulator with XRE-family HTH domain